MRRNVIAGADRIDNRCIGIKVTFAGRHLVSMGSLGTEVQAPCCGSSYKLREYRVTAGWLIACDTLSRTESVRNGPFAAASRGGRSHVLSPGATLPLLARRLGQMLLSAPVTTPRSASIRVVNAALHAGLRRGRWRSAQSGGSPMRSS